MKNSNLSDQETEANDDRCYSVTSGNDLYAERVVSVSDSKSYLNTRILAVTFGKTARREIIISAKDGKQIQIYCFVATKGC